MKQQPDVVVFLFFLSSSEAPLGSMLFFQSKMFIQQTFKGQKQRIQILSGSAAETGLVEVSSSGSDQKQGQFLGNDFTNTLMESCQ